MHQIDHIETLKSKSEEIVNHPETLKSKEEAYEALHTRIVCIEMADLNENHQRVAVSIGAFYLLFESNAELFVIYDG